MLRAAVVLIPLLILVLAIPALIGVYVYRDAKQRKMNAVLWLLIAALAPGFVGLIIYLLVRNDPSDRRCPECGQGVSASFALCPYCGAALKEHCRSCGAALEYGWNSCPHCGAEIPPEQRVNAELPKTDRRLKWLLLLLIMIPLIVLLLFIALSAGRSTGGYSDAWEVDITYERMEEINPELAPWLEECRMQDRAHILTHRFEDENGNHQEFLLCFPQSSYDIEPVVTQEGLFRRPQLNFRCSRAAGGTGYTIFYYVGESEDLRYTVTENGTRISINETEWPETANEIYPGFLE